MNQRFTILGRSFGYSFALSSFEGICIYFFIPIEYVKEYTLNCSLKTAQKKQENLKQGLFNAPLSARVARHFPRKRGKLRERDCRHLQPPLLAGEGDHAKRGGRGEIMSVGSGTVLTKRFSQAN